MKVENFNHNVSYYLGNFFIISALIGFLVLFFPFLQIYIAPPVLSKLSTSGTFVSIPKINAQAPILENIDPLNEQIYKEALKKGVAHAKGTAKLGENGTSFLFAHSSGFPWELTRYNTIFLRLGELQKDDEIKITKNGKEITYKVYDKKEVLPSEVNYLSQAEKDRASVQESRLILQTCSPIGTSLRRLLIFAKHDN